MRIAIPVLVTWALILPVAGCAPKARPVFPVSGTLTYKGQPMAGALIVFHPLEDEDPRALRSYATADKEGKYKLTTYSVGDGAPGGFYVVTILWPDEPVKKGVDPIADEENAPPDRLHKLYSRRKSTSLRATVDKPVNVADFSLP